MKARFLCKIADKPFQCRNGKLIFFLKRNVLLHLQLLKFTQRKLIENMFSLKGFYQTPFKNSAVNFLSSKTISRCTVAIKKENNIKSQIIPFFIWKTCLNIVNWISLFELYFSLKLISDVFNISLFTINKNMFFVLCKSFGLVEGGFLEQQKSNKSLSISRIMMESFHV